MDATVTYLSGNWPVVVALLAGAAVIGWLALGERAAKYGRHVHAHTDGTVHEHTGGHRDHQHPTFVERYDALLTRALGPRPETADTGGAPDPAVPGAGGHRPGCPCTCP